MFIALPSLPVNLHSICLLFHSHTFPTEQVSSCETTCESTKANPSVQLSGPHSCSFCVRLTSLVVSLATALRRTTAPFILLWFHLLQVSFDEKRVFADDEFSLRLLAFSLITLLECGVAPTATGYHVRRISQWVHLNAR